MSRRAIQVQVILILLVLSFGASVGWVPGDLSSPDSRSVTVEGSLTTQTGAPVSRGQVVAFPITFTGLGGYIPAPIKQSGQFSLTLTRDVSYSLVYFEYSGSRANQSRSASITRDGVPDTYSFAEITANRTRQLEPVTLPRGHPVRVKIAQGNQATEPVNDTTVGIAAVRDNRPAGGFANESVDADGYAQNPATGGRKFELSGPVLIEVNSSTRATAREYRRNITSDGQITITLNQSS